MGDVLGLEDQRFKLHMAMEQMQAKHFLRVALTLSEERKRDLWPRTPPWVFVTETGTDARDPETKGGASDILAPQTRTRLDKILERISRLEPPPSLHSGSGARREGANYLEVGKAWAKALRRLGWQGALNSDEGFPRDLKPEFKESEAALKEWWVETALPRLMEYLSTSWDGLEYSMGRRRGLRQRRRRGRRLWCCWESMENRTRTCATTRGERWKSFDWTAPTRHPRRCSRGWSCA